MVVITLYILCFYFQLKGDTSNGVDALKKHPKVRSVTPQKRVERFLKSVEGTGWCNLYCHLYVVNCILHVLYMHMCLHLQIITIGRAQS